ncbi:MAG TPA: fibronectin type III domain-containing protein [Candidatus Angelobacter sp.]|nr:fibronectin type III domain-containing protein [Candidatus Angelobacter sp.]
MKNKWTMAGLSLLFFTAMVWAQTSTMDQASEKNVHITQGPTVNNISGTTATIQWTTNKAAANHVKYRAAGSGNWQSAYHAGGSTNHSLQLTGLQPGKTYQWQILTRDGDVRTSGQFRSAATANGTAPAVSAGNPGTPGAATGTKVPLYRFVSTNSDEHTFSASASAPSGFRLEGPAGYVMQSQAPGTVPLYSLTSSSDEMLSTNASEGAGTYQNSGIVGYVATSQQPGTVPLYRLVSTKDGKHFATANPQEHAQLISSGGFKDDGTIGYVWQQ